MRFHLPLSLNSYKNKGPLGNQKNIPIALLSVITRCLYIAHTHKFLIICKSVTYNHASFAYSEPLTSII